ncbi:MAG: hypothetical protein EZS28_037793 [Streblomastix strix]|uniref:SPRY domain-containing protein n=1 Tax=Streblomastix strix TaxID=222440 RepID=A0A5J4U902_9EUKA|nr:MAG: hypothetical protein EZS28_037793 [Streblomastix strix]
MLVLELKFNNQKQNPQNQDLKPLSSFSQSKYTCRSTVAFNPIVQSGIVRFGGFFEDPLSYIPNFTIGIADSSAVFGSDEYPDEGENEKKTVCYWSGGEISHIGYCIPGNSGIESNKYVSCEVNMNISPRTLTFFYDNQEQGLSVRNIPSSIRFWICL